MKFAHYLAPLLMVSLFACDGGNDTDTDTSTDTSTDTDTDSDTDVQEDAGFVRLAHFGVFPGDADTAVDIFVQAEASGITFSFKDTTDYVALPPGDYRFDVVPAGGFVNDAVLTVEDFTVEKDVYYSVFAAGYVAPTGDNQELTLGAFVDNTEGIPAGNIRLNVVHAAALGAFDPVDVWVVDDACAPVGTEPLLPGFNFLDVAADLDLPSGALGVGLDVGANATVDACFQVPDLGGDLLVNVYAVNNDAGEVSLVAHLPDGTNAEVTPTAN